MNDAPIASLHALNSALSELIIMAKKLKRGAPKGHPGWGGRPRGVTMPCGWCGEPMTAAGIRQHWQDCPKRPKSIPANVGFNTHVL